MKIDFNDKDDGQVSQMIAGDFEKMLKIRKEKLGHIQDAIQKTLRGYDGGSIAIIVMKEDENGMPEGRQLFMGGTCRPEVQMALGAALSEASEDVVKVLLKSTDGDPKKLLSLTKQIINYIEKERS